MVNLPAIIIANGAAVLLLLIVILNRNKAIRGSLLDEKLLTLMMWLTITIAISETLSFVVDGKRELLCIVFAYIFNSADYCLNIILTFVWVVYIDYKHHEDKERLKRVCPVLAIPAAAVIVCVLINLFVPIMFEISPDNIYNRVGIHIVPFVVSYAYLIYGAVMAYRAQGNSGKSKRYLFLPAVVFLIPCFIASVLQYFIYGISLIWLGTAIGLVSLYINLQNQTNYIDLLSGAYNRQYLDHYLTEWSNTAHSEKVLVGYMLDIDGFKEINDRFGHLAGDKTISDVGCGLRRVVGPKGFVSRYGGDEFVVIRVFGKEEYNNNGADGFMKKLENLKIDTAGGNKVHFSIGSGKFQNDEIYDTFIKKIDERMYISKQKYHLSKNTRNIQ